MYKVLLVEDSSESYELVKRALSSSVQLEWAKSLADAYKAIQKKSFSLILLDVMLPDGDGYRLCSIMQNDDRIEKVPVIFLTAKNSVSDKVLGFLVGGDDFITKPFDMNELRTRVEARLRKLDREKFRLAPSALRSSSVNSAIAY
jgi:DNA-binding response OmpR family regulator